MTELVDSLGGDEADERMVILARIIEVSDLEAERIELPVLERGKHLLRRKEVYEQLDPETKQGGAPRAQSEKLACVNQFMTRARRIYALAPSSFTFRSKVQVVERMAKLGPYIRSDGACQRITHRASA